MPELPEVEGLAAWMRSQLMGRRIAAVRLRSVAALKTFEPPINRLVGETITGASRRGKYLALEVDKLTLVSHLSLGGWVRWAPGSRERKPSLRGPIIAELSFEDGVLDFTEHGKEKRLALWLVHDLVEVPQIAGLGPEALSSELDDGAFSRLLRTQRGTLKSVLANQRVIAGIGNAYSDEILHAAKLSPFLLVSKLDDVGAGVLYSAMRSVLSEAVARASGMTAATLKENKRTHFAVHARDGQPCPICGDTIRSVWAGARSFQYCPTCQTAGRVYKDRRLSRLLK